MILNCAVEREGAILLYCQFTKWGRIVNWKTAIICCKEGNYFASLFLQIRNTIYREGQKDLLFFNVTVQIFFAQL